MHAKCISRGQRIGILLHNVKTTKQLTALRDKDVGDGPWTRYVHFRLLGLPSVCTYDMTFKCKSKPGRRLTFL